jgi:hypothetical protein
MPAMHSLVILLLCQIMQPPMLRSAAMLLITVVTTSKCTAANCSITSRVTHQLLQLAVSSLCLPYLLLLASWRSSSAVQS